MKANGRRRWRKARAPHAKVRTFYGPKTKREESEGPFYRIAAFIRRHRFTMKADGKTAAQWYPSPLPAKPFTARSLVGMTQGARKRRAWNEAYTPFCLNEPMIGEAPTMADSTGSMKSVFTYDHEAAREMVSAYLNTRPRYRIGERLRPCPGCSICVMCSDCEVRPCTCGNATNDDCDGAGVIAARGKGER